MRALAASSAFGYHGAPRMIQTHLAAAALALACLAVAAIDARTQRIPDALNAAILLAGLVATSILGFSLLDAAIGAALGYAALWGVNAVYRARRGRDGLGMGDAKFMAAAGAWVGWALLPFVLAIGAALGLCSVAIQRLRGKRFTATDAIALGPYLAAGLMLVWAVRAYS